MATTKFTHGDIERLLCATYDRVSTKHQGQFGYGLKSRRVTTDDWFAARRAYLERSADRRHRYQDGYDEDAPGHRLDLPDLERLLADAKRGEFEAVVIPSHDRFSRTVGKAETLKEQLAGYGVRLIFEDMELADSDSADIVHTIKFALAQDVRKQNRRRLMEARRTKATERKVIGLNRAPYGLRFTYETLPSGRQRVAGIAVDWDGTGPAWREDLLKLREHSTVWLADDLNARGVPTPTGRRLKAGDGRPPQWSDGTVYAMATNPVYKGEWTFRPQRVRPTDPLPEPIVVPCEALLSAEEWDEIQRGLARRRGSRPPKKFTGDDDPYLLRGALRCGLCGRALRSVAATTTSPSMRDDPVIRYYACPCGKPRDARRCGGEPCGLPWVLAAAVEEEAKARLREAMAEANFAASVAEAEALWRSGNELADDRLAAIDARIGKRRRELDGWLRVLASPETGEESRAMVAREQAAIERALVGLKAERAEAERLPRRGLSPEAALGVQGFRARVLRGMESEEASDWRGAFGDLRWTGTVWLDPEGVRLGQRHRYRIAWEADVRLGPSDGDDAAYFVKYAASSPTRLRLLLASDGAPAARAVLAAD